MDLRLLREATRAEHEATERAIPLMDPALTSAQYVQVLSSFDYLVAAWDDLAQEAAPPALRGFLQRRRRSTLLQNDLAFFNQAPTSPASFAPVRSQIADLIALGGAVAGSDVAAELRWLGAIYVMEGSTLGGRYIAAHVEQTLGLQPGCGDSFFRGYEERTIPMWRETQQLLVGIPDGGSNTVIEAACAMFALVRQTILHI